MRVKSAWAWALVALWLAGTAYGFWAFELKQQRSFESRRTVLFDLRKREQAAQDWFRANIASRQATPARATVVHVYAADCPCNRFTHPHLARIMAAYQSRGVRFIAEPQSALSALAWIEATPAALVFDAGGKLVYFGPYSDSGRCGDGGGGLVERVLDRMLAGQTLTAQPFYGGGCFCAPAHNI